jgi:hypothetical protein
VATARERQRVFRPGSKQTCRSDFKKQVYITFEHYVDMRDPYSGPALTKPTRDHFQLRMVHPRPEDHYVTCVPFVTLKIAAETFGDGQYVENENWEWAEISTTRHLRPGMFVAQVVGKSMEPQIPDGSYCLFVAPVEGQRRGP